MPGCLSEDLLAMKTDEGSDSKIRQNSTGRYCFLGNSNLERRETLASKAGHKT
jgi:hypothetical protein